MGIISLEELVETISLEELMRSIALEELVPIYSLEELDSIFSLEELVWTLTLDEVAMGVSLDELDSIESLEDRMLLEELLFATVGVEGSTQRTGCHNSSLSTSSTIFFVSMSIRTIFLWVPFWSVSVATAALLPATHSVWS